MATELPDAVRSSIDTWLSHHDRLAPGLIEGLYVVGSVALHDWWPDSDIDIVAFTADPATDDDAELLRAAHHAAALESTIPIDGPRLAWGDVSVPPLPLHRPWSLDGSFHHDGECFEINPITWFTLATHGVAVRGEPTTELGVAIDVTARRDFVRGNVASYWRSVGEQIAAAATDVARSEFAAETVEWCVLGIARMLYTYRTGDVASKTDAGRWAMSTLPPHAEVLDLAVQLRGTFDPAPVGRAVLGQVGALVDDVVRAIATET